MFDVCLDTPMPPSDGSAPPNPGFGDLLKKACQMVIGAWVEALTPCFTEGTPAAVSFLFRGMQARLTYVHDQFWLRFCQACALPWFA